MRNTRTLGSCRHKQVWEGGAEREVQRGTKEVELHVEESSPLPGPEIFSSRSKIHLQESLPGPRPGQRTQPCVHYGSGNPVCVKDWDPQWTPHDVGHTNVDRWTTEGPLSRDTRPRNSDRDTPDCVSVEVLERTTTAVKASLVPALPSRGPSEGVPGSRDEKTPN